MASSDEEGEIVPCFVNNYWFENDKEEFVPLSSLTLLWSISEINCSLETKIFLRGTADDGLQKIHKQITGWKFELSYNRPEISVLSKDRNWITLQRPRKCFESTIRTVLVTISWVHFVKWNPEEPGISIWSKIMKDFRHAFSLVLCVFLISHIPIHSLMTCLFCSSFDVMPSENDVLDHVWLIREAAKRDEDLAKSKVCTPVLFLLEYIKKGYMIYKCINLAQLIETSLLIYPLISCFLIYLCK